MPVAKNIEYGDIFSIPEDEDNYVYQATKNYDEWYKGSIDVETWQVVGTTPVFCDKRRLDLGPYVAVTIHGNPKQEAIRMAYLSEKS